MELNYLHEFVVLARNCHFQDAAAELFISQSSLSKHIKAIEAELGQELFNRSTRKVELSDFGKEFLPYATKIAEVQQEYHQKLLSKPDPHSKKIRIGISRLITLYNMQDLLVDFTQNGPGYQIEIVDLDDGTPEEMFSKGKCEMIVSHEEYGVDLTEYCQIPYTSDFLVAVLPASHPLALQPCITVTQLSGLDFIQLGQMDLLHLLGSDIKATYNVSRASTMMKLIAKGAGVGIVTRYYARYNQAANVSIVPITPEIILRMNIYYPRHQSKNPAITYILKWFQEKK